MILRSVLVTPPVEEPLTIAQAKQAAGLDWSDGDPRDAQMQALIAAARQQVEADTTLALLTQTRDVFYDTCWTGVVELGTDQCRPLQQVTEVVSIDGAGEHPIYPAPGVGMLRPPLTAGPLVATYPTTVAGYRVRLIAGWTSPADLPPLLVHAVRLLVAHYATAGRDLATVGAGITPTPYGYTEAISPFTIVSLA
jgi:uncharacterized phiE125 gp8 family phage protein